MAHGNSRTSPALILLSGLPGTGKTTFAHALLEALPARHIESDAIRRRLAKAPAYTSAENAIVFGRAEAMARQALKAGQTVIIDATNLTQRDRRRFMRLARSFDVTLVCVCLVAPETVVRGRLALPREGFSQATLEVYGRMRARLRPFSTPVVVVDTRYSIAPSVALVRALVEVSE